MKADEAEIQLEDVQNRWQEVRQCPEPIRDLARSIHSMHRHRDVKPTGNLRQAFEARTGVDTTRFIEPLLQSGKNIIVEVGFEVFIFKNIVAALENNLQICIKLNY